ncbi:MAG: hypothetical protein WCP79_15180, partial [Bacillota bacterium]
SDSTINMGASNVTGQLSLTSDKGDIVQTGAIVAGELVLNAGIGDISLDIGNHVGSLVVLNAGNASYTDTAGFDIGAKGISVNGDLSLKAQGDIIQSETLTSGVIVPGTATFDVGKNGIVRMHGILNGEDRALTRNRISRLEVNAAKQFRLISNASLVIGGINIYALNEEANVSKLMLIAKGDITQDGEIRVDAKNGFGNMSTVLFMTLNENGNIVLKNDGIDNDIKGAISLYNIGNGSHAVKFRNISDGLIQYVTVGSSATGSKISNLDLEYPNSGICPIFSGYSQPGSTCVLEKISITCGGDLTQRYYDDKGNAYTSSCYVVDAGKTDPQVILKVGGKIDLTAGKYNRFSKIKIIGQGTEYTIKNINNIFLNGITTQDEQVINY